MYQGLYTIIVVLLIANLIGLVVIVKQLVEYKKLDETSKELELDFNKFIGKYNRLFKKINNIENILDYGDENNIVYATVVEVIKRELTTSDDCN